MLKLWDIVLVFVSNEITVEHPLISAQPTTTNTVEYITSPTSKATHSTAQNSGVAGRGGARGGEHGLRNYECFPSSHLPHAKCSPWKGKTACEMLPPGKGFTSN